MSKYSFVIPCYRSEQTIEKVVAEIHSEMAKRSDEYEIVLVNDYSPDGVWAVISNMARNSSGMITAVNLAKNFGQHAALLAGYAYCTGDFVVSLDDDGQAPLDYLDALITEINKGYDVVYAYYDEIQQNTFRKFGTWMAKKMGEVMLDQPKDLKGSSFYIARKYIIDEMIKYKNSYPYLGGLVFRVTKNISCVKTKHRARLVGESGYSFRRLFSLWLNGFTAFSVKPLEFSTLVGSLFAVFGFIYALVIIIRKFAGLTTVEGWSTIIALILLIGGMILISLGLIGEYIGRMYICINNSPQYVIKEVVKEDL